MDSNFVDSIEKMLLADQKANEALSEGMRQIVKAINANRTAFSIKNKIIEEDIDRGAKLTNHRISL